MEFIAKIFDLILLNLIFISSCSDHHHLVHPPASPLLCDTLKMVRGEDPTSGRISEIIPSEF